MASLRASPGFRKVRAAVIATCFAAAVFTGAAYGAGLKTQQEWDEERSKFRQSPIEEQIAMLESQRNTLVAQRQGLEDKLQLFEQRVRERNAQKQASQAAETGR